MFILILIHKAQLRKVAL